MTIDVFEAMGTVVSLALADASDRGAVDALAAVERQFAALDHRYSLYRPDSELSRVARGDLALTASSDELRATYAAALRWRDDTGGAFTPHRPDGVIDLNGTVKALAMQAAADELLDAGYSNWCLNAGGDVLCAGNQSDGSAWRVGVVDPADRSALLFSIPVEGSRRAVATSGSAERGDHIWMATAIDRTYLQATVVADDIETADVLATAIIAGGPNALASLAERWSIDVLTVARDGSLSATPGLTAALGRA
ncbi:FAD:protein FMN transferase [Lacisediminihabitans sp. FW035]